MEGAARNGRWENELLWSGWDKIGNSCESGLWRIVFQRMGDGVQVGFMVWQAFVSANCVENLGSDRSV